MQNRLTENRPQNTQYLRLTDAAGNSVDFVDDLAESKKLFRRLASLGVILTKAADGRLAFDAPAGVLSDDLIDLMRARRDDLLELVESIEERAAITQFDGGLNQADAERWARSDVLERV